MSTFRLHEAADVLGVSFDTARRWVETGRLPVVRDRTGIHVVESAALVTFARWLAENPETEGGIGSARNRLRGLVTDVVRDAVMAQVEMRVGPHRVVSLMTREAADELGLAPGVAAVATFKSTDVVVDIPEKV